MSHLREALGSVAQLLPGLLCITRQVLQHAHLHLRLPALTVHERHCLKQPGSPVNVACMQLV